MLTSNHFIFLALAFVVSVVLGILLRIAYNSKTIKKYPTRVKNVIILTIIFPIISYYNFTRNKSDFIEKIKEDKEMKSEQKEKLLQRLSSDRRIFLMVLFTTIRRFKEIIDMNVEFLNDYKDKHEEELELSLKIKIEVRRINKDSDYFNDNINGMFA